MKIIFLDYEVALNSKDDILSRHMNWQVDMNRALTHNQQNRRHFDERCVRWLDYIIKKTGAKIVVTSPQRKQGLDYIKNLWIEEKLPGEVLDITSNYRVGDLGKEISMWLKCMGENVTNYVILTDKLWFLDESYEAMKVFSRQVKCDPEFGLTMPIAEKAFLLLILEETPPAKAKAELITTLKSYIALLGSEINDMIGISHVHGWQSRNIGEGEKLRAKIEELELKATVQ